MKNKFSNVLSILMALITVNSFGADALLIGVSSYPQSPLPNPVNDVQLISKSLISKGWNTKIVMNPKSQELKESVRNFYEKNKNSNEPSLVYFSGHGIQYKGENYLLPTDILEKTIILSKAISITEISYFARDNKGPKIFIIDACRNSPLGKESISVSSGLNSQYAPPNSLIAYATAPGEVAFDGIAGTNSPYAKAFANSFETYGTLEEVFKKTRISTMLATGGKQLPWESSSLYQEVNLSQKKIETIQNQTYQNVVNSQDTGNKSNNQIQLAAPTIPDIKYDSFQSALDSLKSTVEKSPITAFNKLNGVQANERDKQDFIATIDSERIRYKSNPAGVSYKLITTLQTGILYPNCKKGNGIDPSCGDFDRNFKLTPNLKLSLELSKIANSEKIRSDKLAIHYMNGWGVEKDLLKAYELFESDKLKSGVVSEYWWVNINSMIQKELKNLGAKIEVDGDFGASSCKTLSEFIGVTKCGRVVTKEQVYALISKNKKSIE